ncbi:MAG TPA: DUF1800 family protein [Xanthomonadales bacterium]|nr:DUF1800 family protein [Xanthomonadales bacterium]
MSNKGTKKRRDFLRIGAGSVAAAGLAGVGVVASSTASADGQDGRSHLKPLYRRGHQPPDSPAPSASDLPDPAVRALRRLTFGYRPEDLTSFQALGGSFDDRLEAWVDAQLAGYVPSWPPANDPPLEAEYNHPEFNFETLEDDLPTLWQERVLAQPPWPLYQYPLIETQYLALIRATYSQWQLAEVLADFWHTHFSVYGGKFEVSPVFVHYDRDVIRPNMLGNFRQMIGDVTRSTAMMYYLDNVWNSKYGPNENFARELQELHTLGAIHSFGFTPEGAIPDATQMAGSSTVLPAGLKAGYSEADVAQVTLCLTGWTISNQYTTGGNTGEFVYHSEWHEESQKRVMGIDISATGQGETSEVLDLLAMHPGTARYVCEKLCRRLIGDSPVPAIVEQAATVFNDQWQAPDQLQQVVRTIILSNEFKDSANWGSKSRRPFELIAGTFRSCGGPAQKLVRPEPFGNWALNMQNGVNYKFSQDLYWLMSETGQMPFGWVTPDGFPDTKPAWLGSTPLVMTWRVLNFLLLDWVPDDLFNPGGNWHEYFPVDATSTTKNSLTVSQRTASNIVDYWVNAILGYDATSPATPQLDSGIRDLLVAFMQQNAASPETVLDLDADDWDNQPWLAYVPQRLQALVASISMLPENLRR